MEVYFAKGNWKKAEVHQTADHLILLQEILQADVVHQEEKNNQEGIITGPKPVSNACRFFYCVVIMTSAFLGSDDSPGYGVTLSNFML